MKPTRSKPAKPARQNSYPSLLRTVVTLLDEARRASARTVNVIMTATYWQVGRDIVEFEQAGERRAGYGQQLLEKLSTDLNNRFGRGFSTDNLETMRLFYLAYLDARKISETPSRELLPPPSGPVSAEISETASRKFNLALLAEHFPLSWSHYVMLVRRSRSPEARAFYETEALRGGWGWPSPGSPSNATAGASNWRVKLAEEAPSELFCRRPTDSLQSMFRTSFSQPVAADVRRL